MATERSYHQFRHAPSLSPHTTTIARRMNHTHTPSHKVIEATALLMPAWLNVGGGRPSAANLIQQQHTNTTIQKAAQPNPSATTQSLHHKHGTRNQSATNHDSHLTIRKQQLREDGAPFLQVLWRRHCRRGWPVEDADGDMWNRIPHHTNTTTQKNSTTQS